MKKLKKENGPTIMAINPDGKNEIFHQLKLAIETVCI